MPLTIRDLPKEKYVLPGNAACPGCPEAMGLRYVGMALGSKAILVIPAGCTSIIQGLMPGSGLSFPIVNVAFSSADAVASGVAVAKELIAEESVVVVWAGDGATADIGFATLSGAAERNDNIIHICVDNEAYMNTGIQRSSLTPLGAWTTTTWRGKTEPKKNMPLIMISHGVPYVATASVAYPMDFIEKLRKAASIKGFKYIHLHAPCPVGWRFDPSETVEIARLAIETGMWVLMEAENGKIRISPPSKPYIDKNRRKPLKEYLERQGRF
ncbi:MAG: 3-methyl-2-oxobutanoate dehydrogenase subunit beta, partial [Sulfolobales archaeon]